MQICWLVHVQPWEKQTWGIKTLQRNNYQKQEDAAPTSNQEGEAPWYDEILTVAIYGIQHQ